LNKPKVNVGFLALHTGYRLSPIKACLTLIAYLNTLTKDYPDDMRFCLMVFGDRTQDTWNLAVNVFKDRWRSHFTHTWELALPDSLEELIAACPLAVYLKGDERHQLLVKSGVKAIEYTL
jgi:hypothetical protein